MVLSVRTEGTGRARLGQLKSLSVTNKVIKSMEKERT